MFNCSQAALLLLLLLLLLLILLLFYQCFPLVSRPLLVFLPYSGVLRLGGRS